MFSPQLYIVAGPNGVGKSTLYPFLTESLVPADIPYINADVIARQLNPPNPDAAVLEAEQLVNRQRGEFIAAKKSFIIETNLATNGSYNLIEAAGKAGFDIILLFLCLGDVNDCIRRVAIRVQEGGHFVPDEIIKHRYTNSLSLLKSNIVLFTKAYLIDNTNSEMQLTAITAKTKIEYIAPNPPAWTVNVMQTISLLNTKHNRQ